MRTLAFAIILLLGAALHGGSIAGEPTKDPAPLPGPAPAGEPKKDPKADPYPETPEKSAESAARLAKLLRDFNSQDPAVREAAAKAVMAPLQEQIKAEKRPYTGALNEDLKNPDAPRREDAVKRLGAIMEDLRKGYEKGLYEMFAYIDSADPAKQERGRAALVSRIADVIEGGIVAKAIEDLANADKAVVDAAVAKLLEIGEGAGSYLVDALEDERLAVKTGVRNVLKTLGPKIKDNAGDLAFLLDSDDKLARRFAGEILEILGPEAADCVEDLVQYLEHDEKPVRRSAANILKKIGPAAKPAVTDLVEMLTHEEKNVRSLAQEVLVGLAAHAVEGAEGLADIIDDAAADPDGHDAIVRAAAVLAAIGPEAKSALPALKKHQEDAQPAVKEAVGLAIKKIEGK